MAASSFNSRRRTALLLGMAALLAAAIAVLFWHVQQQRSAQLAATQQTLPQVARAMREDPAAWFAAERDFTALARDLDADRVTAIGLARNSVLVSTRGGQRYFVLDGRATPVADWLLARYRDRAAPFQVTLLNTVSYDGPGGHETGNTLEAAGRALNILVMLGLVGALVWMMRGGGGGRQYDLNVKVETTFDDVVGAKEAKHALQDIAAFLKAPASFAALGARPSSGVLMSGPPGTGKTLLARALAGECGVSFISASGSDFTSKFYGVGPMKVKALFKAARKHAPCILFIDEIDGIGKRTTSGNGPAESEGNRIINQILVEMDGFKADEGVIVVGATNLVDNVDEALLREGRFDRRVHVKLPDVIDREGIFQLYTGRVKAESGIDYALLARLTTGLAPAALASIVNQATLLAAKLGREQVGQAELTEAIEISRMGEVNGAVRALTAEERERVAVHEAGHAVIAELLGVGRVEKVTILPRGGALGVTLVSPPEDRHLHRKSELENRIVMLLGGRCAELLTFGEASTGASHDLQEASRIALAMVAQYGFGSKGSLFNLAAIDNPALVQPEMGNAIEEAKDLLARLEQKCMACLTSHAGALHQIVEALLDKETVPGETVAQAVANATPELRVA
ncbi:AAA family ATPase [Chitiniphilus purpureus]|uniref:AAA family ATPase n=1 Tax=Chitiniphilus purpureus TaxID=2981137 RepID=A0ABY6DJN4_9NEIS|nr:AAA family ATPase [Chitiniphilus sp. CD1]UXY14547.1 AAA family ATPase [Chitiniphilus sp. CD1]